MTPADLAIRETALPEADAVAAQPATAYAVDAAGLSKRYGRRWVLADVGFRLPRGKTLLVGGHNGSGKSTLFRILATAISADRGEATIDGFPLGERTRVRERVALFGHHSHLYESLSAIENLKVTASICAPSTDLFSLLEEVGLRDHADGVVSTFSAGMRRRLSLARFLMRRPRVAFLDEPYGALDPAGFKLMDATIRKLQNDGATVLLATHLVDRGAELADFGLLLENGRVAWSGSASSFPTQTMEDHS